MEKIITNSFTETQKVAAEFAGQILRRKPAISATVLALKGDLGAGKTTFLQGFAKGLGIEENILSPTFVIMKKFQISNSSFKMFYHFDLYRLNSAEEILQLDFKEIINNPENIVAIEWPEKISDTLSKNAILIEFNHLESASAKGSGEAMENKREIIITL